MPPFNQNTEERRILPRYEYWHLSKAIPISLIIGLLGQIFLFGWWAATMDIKIHNNYEAIQQHKKDFTVHAPYDVQAKNFVPRVEIDGRLTNIANSLTDIKESIKRLEDKR